jgi:RimJ/RimL family protein N-acetyltransferase
MKLPTVLPVLHHGSITLRVPLPNLELLKDGATDPYIRVLYGIPELPNTEFAIEYANRQKARLELGFGASFEIAEADRAVGIIGLWLRGPAPDGPTAYREPAHGRASIGYWIAPSHRRRGYATQGLQAISEWALGYGDVYRLDLFIEPWNAGSWRAAEGAGYQREGLLRSWQLIGDTHCDMSVYSRLPPDPA